MGQMVERRGYNDTMQGFDYYMLDDADGDLYYSIWHGTKLKHFSKKVGNDARTEFGTLLDVWRNSGTSGTLEVRFHTSRPTAQLNNKSDYCGSFCFTMDDDRIQRDVQYRQMQASNSQESPIRQMLTYMQEMEELKAYMGIGSIGSDAPAPVVEETWWDKFKTIMDMPVVEDFIAGAAEKFFGIDMSGFKQQSSMAGDIKQIDTAALDAMDETQEQRLRKSLAILADGEPDFVEMMEKLADLKLNKPSKYNLAKMML